MAKYLLDTDWAIHYLRGKKDIVKAIDEYRKDGIVISAISIAELYDGVYRSPNPEQKEIVLLDFIEGFRIANITRSVARLFGQNGLNLKSRG